MSIPLKGALVGAITGAIARGVVLFAYMMPYLQKMWLSEPFLVPVALTPSIIIGAGIGAVAGSRPRMWQGVLIGALLSMLTFFLWSNGPIEWWVLSIRFNARLTVYFGVAGALAGLVPAVFVGRKK